MMQQDLEEATPAPGQALDEASLERLKRFGGGKLLGQMIGMYLEAAPARIATARGGVAAGDAKSVEMALHSLKSSSAQLGALAMQRLCERGERNARDGQLTELPEIIAGIDAEYPQVVAWLEKARSAETA